MSTLTLEHLLQQIATLPLDEQRRLANTLQQDLNGAPAQAANGDAPRGAPVKPEFKFLKPLPVPDPAPSEGWLAVHEHEYDGQWIALDGDRLIAHGQDADAVFAAARADGAYLPLVFYVIPAEAPPFIGV